MYDRAHGLHIFSGGFCLSRLVGKGLSEGSTSIEIPEVDWSVVNSEEAAFFSLDDPDRLADERLAQEDAAAPPLDLAVAADPPHIMVCSIVGFTQPAGIDARRRLVVFRRRVEAECLMRTLLVEDATELIETTLLSPSIGRRRETPAHCAVFQLTLPSRKNSRKAWLNMSGWSVWPWWPHSSG